MRRMRRLGTTLTMLAAGVLVAGLAGCGPTAGSPNSPAPAGTSPAAALSQPPPTDASPSATDPSRPQPQPAPADAPVVVLDPGHNGGNATHPAQINRLVPDGRGRTKPCNTTGTATNSGYTEHAFTWDVATRVRAILAEHGVKVVMTRDNDTGVGPCVNERAAIGNRANAAAVVSIHADGSTSAGAHGFHVAYSAPPLNAEQGEPSLRLATTLRDTLRSAGFATANYIGSNGLSPRNDLAGLNLSERPAALVECGNMRDAAEAAVLSSSDGRQRYAQAIADAVLAYLPGR